LAEGELAQQRSARDDAGRVVAGVRVNGQGPFRFIVDTGANRSVLSMRLAERLGLQLSGEGAVNLIESVRTAPLAEVSSLEFGALSVRGAKLPVLGGDMFAGEDGILGMDGLAGRWLTLDFERRCVEIRAGRRAPSVSEWGEVRGRLWFGHLITARAQIRGVRIHVLFDTGSDISIGNPALAAALAHLAPRAAVTTDSAISAGRPIFLDRAIFLPRVEMGDVRFNNVTAWIGALHVFDLWRLNDEPTLLVGADLLSQAGAVAIDYSRARIYFRPRRAH
jgi:predicted aspartyl protease